MILLQLWPGLMLMGSFGRYISSGGVSFFAMLLYLLQPFTRGLVKEEYLMTILG